MHRSARITAGVVVYRLDDRLFFANASYVKGRVLEAVRGAPTNTHAVVFDAEGVTHVDATGLAALEDLVDALHKEGIELSVARAKAPLTARLSRASAQGSGFTRPFGPPWRRRSDRSSPRPGSVRILDEKNHPIGMMRPASGLETILKPTSALGSTRTRREV